MTTSSKETALVTYAILQGKEVYHIYSLKRFLVLFLFLLTFVIPTRILAHASLTDSVPEQNSQQPHSPKEIRLTFNERLEKGNVSIKLFNADGESIIPANALTDTNQKQIYLPLSPLENGYYTVSYKVISADGHPISGSYIFTVGETTEAPPIQGGLASKGHHFNHNGLSDFTLEQLLHYVARIVYYMSLLTLVGWIFWMTVQRESTMQEIHALDLQYSVMLQRIFFLMHVVLIGTQLPNLLVEWQLSNILSLFSGTTIGLSWLAMLGLSLFGFLFLHRVKWFDMLWLILMIATKSFSGHASATDSPLQTVLLDIVHLLSAAVWVGGILYILVHWQKSRYHAKKFIPYFSDVALASLVILILTGTLLTLIFLPDLSYLIHTEWGILLLVKSGLVLLVLVVGSLLRYDLRKKNMSSMQKLLGLDSTLMTLIIVVVGLFTYMNPLPTNEPLRWQVNNERLHVAVSITPNQVGTNKMKVSVWLPHQVGKPKNVQLLVISQDTDIPPIDVPIIPVQTNSEQNVIPGFSPYTYEKEGPYLPFAGKWTIQVRVMDPSDSEIIFNKEFVIY
ncbi:copper resistance CopC/CopD family protein [Brevibacillus daliensis]|uniref:copper resistance CopC/CopD family protein n=1 Tax=Brevibacillus daliensis TaxID=2892995 RepID=UPI001E5AED52|nr:copper resistance protein CopC [Brevibacillus daliensis]